MSGDVDITRLIRDSATHICVFYGDFIRSVNSYHDSPNNKIQILDKLNGRWVEVA